MQIITRSRPKNKVFLSKLMAGLLVFLFILTPLAHVLADEPTPENPPPASEQVVSQPDKTPKKQMTQANETSGALTNSYPIDIPPGRNNVQPDLSLSYNSQDADKESLVGQGWSLPIPSIERINRKGVNTLYTDNYFTSSFDGEIVSTGTNTYGAKDENGSFMKYSLSSNVWTVTDKKGTVYTFGQTAASRQDNPSDSSKVFKWMLTEVRDTNDNFVSYEYVKDNGQIYPSLITYTGHGTQAGIFQVQINRETRTDITSSYRTGFLVKTNYRFSDIVISANSSWVTKYVFSYQTGDNGATSILHSVIKSGRAEDTTVTALPATTFDYQTTTNTNHWTQDTSTWSSPIYINFYYGSFTLDVNGDGYDDIVQAVRDTNNVVTKKTYLSNGAGQWTESTGYALPMYAAWQIGNDTTLDMGVRFVDLNGDGLVDVVQEGQGGYINTGSGWAAQDMAWNPPLQLIHHDAIDSPAYFANLNGDNLPDLIEAKFDGSNTLITTVYINNGHGWTESTGWTAPEQINYAYGSMIVDVNGDGLDDVVESANTSGGTIQNTYLNNGQKQWVLNTAYQSPVIFVDRTGDGPFDFGARFVDVNGDGLLDIIQSSHWHSAHAYINTGTGWQENLNWAPPVELVTQYPFVVSPNPANVSSINGDSLTEIWQANSATGSTIETKVYVNNEKKVNLLKKITYPEGGTTDITYKATPLYKNGSTLLNPNLPLNLETVSSIVDSDGNGNSTTTSYIYEGGFYYYNTPFDYKFAGFAKFTATDNVNSTISFYHQGNDTNSGQGEYNDHISKAGKKYREEVRDLNGNLYSKVINTWDKYDLGGGRNFVKLIQTIESTYDGNSMHKDRAITYTYDNSNGNKTIETDKGEVTGADDGTFTDVGSDTLVTTLTYASNTSAGIIGLPSSQITLDQASNKIQELKFYYDALSYGQVNIGNETQRTTWRSTNTTKPASIEKTYNSYGLVISSTDPRGKVTSFTYDSVSMYPVTVTNPLNQTNAFEYDYSSGSIKKLTDANGGVFTTVFDGLDRPLQETQPGSISSGSTVTKATYEYTDVANAFRVKKSSYLDGSNIVESYTYVDGLNRKIQERTEDTTSSQYIVRDFVYANNGLLNKESLPYFSTGSARTSATTTSSLYTTYAYDALQRIISAQTALGSTTNAYDDWKTTTTDPDGKVKDTYLDARTNLVRVDEHDGSSIYTTTYEYNGLNKLTKITDASGNIRNFTYDSLGNVLTAEDLHATSDATFGSWAYSYDAANNLTQQTNPNNQVVNFTYDDLSRRLTEDYTGATGTEVTYTYDTCTLGVGKLCTTANSAVTTNLKYDGLGNVVSDKKTIGSQNLETLYEYDRQNNQITIINPDSSLVHYLYNAGGLVTTVQHKESTDSSFTDVVSTITYNPVGLPLVLTFANGAVTTNTYDATKLYRLSSKVTTAGTSQIQNLAYTYDAIGNISKIVDGSATQTAKTTDYTYDNLHRLQTAVISNPGDTTLDGPSQENLSQSFTYNTIGNIISLPGTGTYSYTGNTGSSYANPHAVTGANGYTYTYDHNGNMTGATIAGDSTTYTWDYNSRLTNINKNSTQYSYAYDVDGQRIKAVTPAGTSLYPTKFYNTTPSGTEKHIFLGDTAIATITGTNTSAHVYIIHADHLTGSNVVTDSTQAVDQLTDYYSFGTLRLDQQNGSYNEKRKFTGHEYDVDTGLTYMDARYYDAKLGRFLSQDPVFQKIMDEDTVTTKADQPYSEYLANPQIQNAYSYVANNPLKYKDPSGETATEAVGGYFVGVGQHFINSFQSVANTIDHPFIAAVDNYFKAVSLKQSISDAVSNPKATVSRLQDGLKSKVEEFTNKSDYDKGKVIGNMTGSAMEVAIAGKVSEGAITNDMRQTLLGADKGVQIGKYNLDIEVYNKGGGGINLRDTTLSGSRSHQRIFGADYHQNPYGPAPHFHVGTGDAGKIHQPWQKKP